MAQQAVGAGGDQHRIIERQGCNIEPAFTHFEDGPQPKNNPGNLKPE